MAITMTLYPKTVWWHEQPKLDKPLALKIELIVVVVLGVAAICIIIGPYYYMDIRRSI